MNKKDNIFYFFILALVIHLSFFMVNEKGVKGDAPLSLKTSSAPISVKVRSSVASNRNQTIAPPKETIAPPPPKEEKKPEPKKIETPKKEIVKPEVKSKIKDNKKKVKKKEIKEFKEESPTEKSQPIKKEGDHSQTTQPQNAPTGTEEMIAGGNFSVGKDGIFTASSSDGIDYKILKQVEPNYPIQAERIRYKTKVTVSARFLVGLNGNIEKIEITKSHKKFGFDDEVQKALKQWKFHPIYYKNKNIKVYFTKDFIFEPK